MLDVVKLMLNWIAGFNLYEEATGGVCIVGKMGKGLICMNGIQKFNNTHYVRKIWNILMFESF